MTCYLCEINEAEAHGPWVEEDGLCSACTEPKEEKPEDSQ